MKSHSSRVAVIGGTSFLHGLDILGGYESIDEVASTPFGDVKVKVITMPGKDIVVVQRHHTRVDGSYAPPHLINHRALFWAFKNVLSVVAIVGLGCVGSLTPRIGLGTLVVPDDYFCPNDVISISDGEPGHIIPDFDGDLRKRLLTAVRLQALDWNLTVHESGVYLQSRGPRFETKAEVRSMARDGDMIGMTCAHEATLAKELGIAYALVCSVDNYANGITPTETLTMDLFRQAVEDHQPVAHVALKAAMSCLGVELPL